MIIDLHVHTSTGSHDSNVDLPEFIPKAKQAGIDGICITEHDMLWDKETLARLSEKHDFLLLPGIEVGSDEGHLLVFGIEQYTSSMWRTKNLKKAVDEADGVIIMSHPFRSLYYGGDNMDAVIERSSQRSVFGMLNAVEVLNGRGSNWQNEFSWQLSRRLDLKGVGGSDAHDLTDIPSCATFFENEIHNVEELIVELKAGRFKPVDLRDGNNSSGK